MKPILLFLGAVALMAGMVACASGTKSTEASVLYYETVNLPDGRSITCIYDGARKWGSCDWSGGLR